MEATWFVPTFDPYSGNEKVGYYSNRVKVGPCKLHFKTSQYAQEQLTGGAEPRSMHGPKT